MNKPQSHKLKTFVVYSYLSKANTTYNNREIIPMSEFFLKTYFLSDSQARELGFFKSW